MSAARRRQRGVFGTIVADPYRKLAAIALAIGLWYYLNQQLETTKTFEVSLETNGYKVGTAASQIRVLLGNPNIVGTRFEAEGSDLGNAEVEIVGPKELIDGLEGEALSFRVQLEGMDWSNRPSYEIDEKDLVRPEKLRGSNVTIKLIPPLIKLHVSQQYSRDLAVAIDRVDLRIDVGADDAARLQRDRARFSAQKATVWGTAADLRSFIQDVDSGRLQPFWAQITSVRDEREVLAVLNLNAPPGLRLSIKPDVSMTIPVQRIEEPFDVEILLQIDDDALPEALRDRYEVADKKRYWKVTIKASGELRTRLLNLASSEDPAALDRWAKQYLRLEVFLSPTDPGNDLDEITREATLVLKGPMRESVSPNEYSLAEPVSISLRRKQ